MNAIEKLNALSFEETGLLDAIEEKQAEWVDHAENIALRILEWLSSNKMSQKDLAEKMGVSPQYISRIVNARENLTLEAVSKLESTLSIKILEIKTSEPILANKCVEPPMVIYKTSPIFTANFNHKDEFSLINIRTKKYSDDTYKQLA